MTRKNLNVGKVIVAPAGMTLDFGGGEKRRVCGHQIMAPVAGQVARRASGRDVPVPGDVRLLLTCMVSVGPDGVHDGDHKHAFQWTNRPNGAK